MKLFAGLGNPGENYARNRHNVGFMAVERIAAAHGFGPWRRRFQGLTAEAELAGERLILLKPQTHMNESGRAVGEAARFLKIAEADIVVFHDEIDLAPGKLKVKRGGGDAGHNGLRSLSAHLGNDYVRVRIGVGHPGSKDLVVHYVLHDFAKADALWLDPLLDAIAKAAGRLALGNEARFLSDVARAIQPSANEPGAGQTAEDKKKAPSQRDLARLAASPSHPTGERGEKRRNALAANLEKWLLGRKTRE